MHSPIMMRGRFEFAYWAGHVSRFALWCMRGGLTWRSCWCCTLDQAVIKAEFIKFGHGPFNVIKGLFLGAIQKLGALRI